MSLATENLGTARKCKTYDPSAGDHDLVADGPDGSKPCRWITVVDSAGTIVIAGVDGVDVTLPAMPQGYNHLVAAKTIKSTSTCTSVIVAW